MLFSQEHIALKDTVNRIIDEHINPNVDAWEEEGIFPAHDVMKLMADAGLLGIGKPVQYGGLDLDFSYEMVFAEALGSIRANGVSTAIGVQTTMCTPALTNYGSEELKQEFLVPTIAGEMVGCIGVSEEAAGSDVANTRTYAKRDGDDYVINGSKMWITNGVQGDWICLLVNTSEEGGPHRNKSLIIVPMKTPGITIEKKIHKIGMWASDTGLIHFDNVRVPQRNLIGMEGAGFMYQMIQFQEERLWGAANSIEGMMHVLNETINYTRQRNLFGSTVLDQQVVHFTLAELKTEIEALRALVWQATEEYVAGGEVTELASMCKLRVSGISG